MGNNLAELKRTKHIDIKHLTVQIRYACRYIHQTATKNTVGIDIILYQVAHMRN